MVGALGFKGLGLECGVRVYVCRFESGATSTEARELVREAVCVNSCCKTPREALKQKIELIM